MKNIWTKRIPTLIAFLMIFSSIWVTSYLIQKGVITIGRASPETNPENIKISNISDSSFTVSFTTKTKAEAIVNYGETQNTDSVAFDDRDKTTGKPSQYNSHHITVSNLKRETPYSFSIVANGTTFLDNEKKFSVTTGKTIGHGPPNQKPIYGKIILSDGSVGEDSLVYVTVENAELTSALSNKKGEYIVPLNSVLLADFSEYFIFDKNTKISIEVFSQNTLSKIETIYERIDSIPTITVSKNYDFTTEITTESAKIATPESNLKTPAATKSGKEIKISSPSQNEEFTDQKPTFKGTAIPGKNVKITINSDTAITQNVKADQNGSWSFRPKEQLAPGNHTITIETIDATGIIKKITQSFTVFASGSQINQTATPSATITPTITIITVSPTIALTPTIQATPEPTQIATSTISPTRIASPTPSNLKPGGVNPSIFLTGASFFLIIAGAFLFLGL